jgi:ABC-type sugar transport system ATPase subunit
MYYQKLFNYMSNEHGVILLESEMQEIIEICDDIKLDIADNFPNMYKKDFNKTTIKVISHSSL